MLVNSYSEAQRAAKRRYKKTEKGKAAARRYRQSTAGKLNNEKYKPKKRINDKRWRDSERGKQCINEYRKKHYEEFRTAINQRNLNNYYKNMQDPKFRERRRIASKLWNLSHRNYYNNRRLLIKEFVIKYYSDGKNCCNCCGETEYRFLCIDHMNNNGGKHRKEIGVSAGTHFYEWLLKNDLPDGYQILCYNCNCTKGFYGSCPHESKKSNFVTITE